MHAGAKAKPHCYCLVPWCMASQKAGAASRTQGVGEWGDCSLQPRVPWSSVLVLNLVRTEPAPCPCSGMGKWGI